MDDQLRVDKWLWAVRVFKTRSIATEACKKKHILIDNIPVKPSRILKIDDIVFVKQNPVTYRYRVLGLVGKRVGAKLVDQYMKDVTPAEELEILDVQRQMLTPRRDKGTGRPTKKDRRDLDGFFEF